jgi:hypothetical protein
MNVEFHGNWTGSGKAYVDVEEKTYLVKKATFDKFNYCTNAKELVEAIEYFAYKEIVEKRLENNEFFELIK